MTYLPDAVVDHLLEAGDALDLSGTKYRHRAVVGEGGMGAVHVVEDMELGREVALKVVPGAGSEQLAERLRREARFIARLEHPGIVPVHDLGRLADGRCFYVMKLVRGERLDRWAAERPPNAILRLFQRVCEAVAFAHARGVIHRDLKPENVMVGPFGEALVVDWGLAKQLGDPEQQTVPEARSPVEARSNADAALADAALADTALANTALADTALADTALAEPALADTALANTALADTALANTALADTALADTALADTALADTAFAGAAGHHTADGAVMGTPAFMAPEQARGEIAALDQRTDVHALGAMLYALLAGRPPFGGKDARDVIRRVIDEEPPPLRELRPELPRPLASICARAMAKAQRDRYATALELAEDVAAFLERSPVKAHRETLPERLGRFVSRHRVLLTLLAAYLLVRVAMAIFVPG